MDWIALRKTTKKYFDKYKVAILILAAGLLLVSLPDDSEKDVVTETVTVQEEITLEERLCGILGKIQGVGEVRVLLTEACGAEQVYQTDDTPTTGDSGIRTQTVTVEDAGRNETGLLKQRISPVYLGAIVVCQGGDNAAIRLRIAEAVANVTGISVSRITVLKMN